MASRGLEQMKDTSSKVVEIPFTVSARTARLIGQENFANAEGAIIELVKNLTVEHESNSKLFKGLIKILNMINIKLL